MTDVKQSIILFLFSRRNGSTKETYVLHIKIWEAVRVTKLVLSREMIGFPSLPYVIRLRGRAEKC